MGQLGSEAIEAHQAGHFFDQIDFASEIQAACWWCEHSPTGFRCCELATEGDETALDLRIGKRCHASVRDQGAQ